MISNPAPEPSKCKLSSRKAPKDPLVATSIIMGKRMVLGSALTASSIVPNTFLLSTPQEETVSIIPCTEEVGIPAISKRRSSRSSKSYMGKLSCSQL